MDEQVKKTLIAQFENKRIVIWYDDNKEFRADFDEIELPSVEKILLNNNEFAVKYRVLREEPKQKFLIYQEGSKPQDKDNWLLDILLSEGEVKTEQSALRLAELNLGYENIEITEKHPAFFKSKERREQLKALVNQNEDTVGKIKTKMLAVCAKADPDIESVLENLFEEYSKSKDEKLKLIKTCQLDEHLFKVLKRRYSYESAEPSIKDFIISLFNYALKVDLKLELKESEKLSTDALVFLKRWKDSRLYTEAFEKISDEVAGILEIENIIDRQDYKKLTDVDYFIAIDQKLLHSLIQEITKKTIAKEECLKLIRSRKQRRWTHKEDIKNSYLALWFATQFMSAFEENMPFDMDSISDGIRKYTIAWQKIDQYYRKFTYYVKKSGRITMFNELSNEIENMYSNKFLLDVNDNWQRHIDKLTEWRFANIEMQRDFFKSNIVPFENKKNKIFVIISDAMRYEIGDEFVSLIRQEDKYDAKISSAISCAPSYTQLGMAALLPNKELKITINEDSDVKNAPVYVDGICSAGKDNRIKILQNYDKMKITAYKAEDVLKKTSDELKSVVKESDVFFVYHNRIDYVGDKLESENRVFDETEDALEELKVLVKKLVAANANNIIITADHGFIYQNRNLDDSDYLGEEPQGTVLYSDRRFIIGRNLKDSNSFKKFSASDLGLIDDFEYLFPKSINRLRKKGSGSKFVHGGLTLQELIIPVIQVNKKRHSDVSKVEVDILKKTDIISSNQLAVKLYQTEPYNDKVQKRVLVVGLYNKDDQLISNEPECTFDSTSNNPRDREYIVNLVLTRDVDKANGQEVKLKLKEKESGSNYYKEYKSTTYMVRKTFTTDFD